jgi:hypothetical protein
MLRLRDRLEQCVGECLSRRDHRDISANRLIEDERPRPSSAEEGRDR